MKILTNRKIKFLKEERHSYEVFSSQFKGILPQLAKIENLTIPSSSPQYYIPIRVYTPILSTKLPVTLYLHGGGWRKGSLNTHDSICKHIALKSESIIISVGWRLAPEYKFPIGLNDCHDVYNWLISEESKMFNINYNRIAIAGDSAGGNLAAALSLRLRDEKNKMPRLQLLIYPSLDLRMVGESYTKFSEGYLLTAEKVKDYIEDYINDENDLQHPLASPLTAEDFTRLPATHLINAEYDPIQDDGITYITKLKEAKIPSSYKCYSGMVHDFLHFPALVPRVGFIFEEISNILRAHLYA
jgi:acetyl esterase